MAKRCDTYNIHFDYEFPDDMDEDTVNEVTTQLAEEWVNTHCWRTPRHPQVQMGINVSLDGGPLESEDY